MRSSRQIQAGGKHTSSHLWTSWVTLPGCWGCGSCYALLPSSQTATLVTPAKDLLCLLPPSSLFCPLSAEPDNSRPQKPPAFSANVTFSGEAKLYGKYLPAHLSVYWKGPLPVRHSVIHLCFPLKKKFWLNCLVQINDCFSGQSFFYFPIIVQTWRQHVCVQCPVAAHWVLSKTHNVLMHLHRNNSSLRGK